MLESIYGVVTLPRSVVRELRSPEAPPPVRAWAANPPAWIEIRAAEGKPPTPATGLGSGEQDAITLAWQEPGSLLLMDEVRGRNAATLLGLRVVGTLGVLRIAHARGLLDRQEAIARLKQTSFRASDALYTAVLTS